MNRTGREVAVLHLDRKALLVLGLGVVLAFLMGVGAESFAVKVNPPGTADLTAQSDTGGT